MQQKETYFWGVSINYNLISQIWTIKRWTFRTKFDKTGFIFFRSGSLRTTKREPTESSFILFYQSQSIVLKWCCQTSIRLKVAKSQKAFSYQVLWLIDWKFYADFDFEPKKKMVLPKFNPIKAGKISESIFLPILMKDWLIINSTRILTLNWNKKMVLPNLKLAKSRKTFSYLNKFYKGSSDDFTRILTLNWKKKNILITLHLTFKPRTFLQIAPYWKFHPILSHICFSPEFQQKIWCI